MPENFTYSAGMFEKFVCTKSHDLLFTLTANCCLDESDVRSMTNRLIRPEIGFPKKNEAPSDDDERN